MIWYKVWLGKIEPVEVDKFTDKTVTIKGRRQSRYAWQFFAPTWEEAHAHMLSEAENSLALARRTLERAQGYLDNIKGMTPPQREAK
jgi:hypothetical protein